MLEFIVKKDFNTGKNLITYLRINSILYDVLRDEWIIELIYFYDQKTAGNYRIAELIVNWIKENPSFINEDSWVWLKENYLDRDLTQIPLYTERRKLVSYNYLEFGTGDFLTKDNCPIVVNEYWYNKSREEILNWVSNFILENKELFKINEIISTVTTELPREQILEPVIEKIKSFIK